MARRLELRKETAAQAVLAVRPASAFCQDALLLVFFVQCTEDSWQFPAMLHALTNPFLDFRFQPTHRAGSKVDRLGELRTRNRQIDRAARKSNARLHCRQTKYRNRHRILQSNRVKRWRKTPPEAPGRSHWRTPKKRSRKAARRHHRSQKRNFCRCGCSFCRWQKARAILEQMHWLLILPCLALFSCGRYGAFLLLAFLLRAFLLRALRCCGQFGYFSLLLAKLEETQLAGCPLLASRTRLNT